MGETILKNLGKSDILGGGGVRFSSFFLLQIVDFT